jgi:hypothetical protein
MKRKLLKLIARIDYTIQKLAYRYF